MKSKRNQKSNYLRKSLFLFIFLAFLSNCNKENNLIETNQQNNIITPLDAKIALKEINTVIIANKSNSKKEFNIFNQINTNVKANKTTLNNSNLSYNFLLNNYTRKKSIQETDVTFDNLFVNIDKNNQIKYYILRYTPEKDWLKNSKNLQYYSGKVEYLSENKNILSTIIFKNGKPANANKIAKRGCMLEYVTTICTNYDGLDLTLCTHYYKENCGSGNGGYTDGGSTEGGGGESSGGGSGSFGGAPLLDTCPDGFNLDPATGYCITEDDQIFNELTGKAKCVYEKLTKSSTDFKNAIKKFDGEFPVSHLMLTINNNLGSGVYGETQPPVNYVTEIQINGDGLSNLSDLGAATTLAHEIVHAEIFRKMLSAAKRGDLNTNTMTQQEAENYVNSLKDNFPGLYDYYVERWYPAWNHNMMASHYINTIADIIQDFDNNRLSRSTYESVAWAGLGEIENNQSTVAWQNLTSSEQQAIIDVLNQYFFNGTSNCN